MPYQIKLKKKRVGWLDGHTSCEYRERQHHHFNELISCKKSINKEMQEVVRTANVKDEIEERK